VNLPRDIVSSVELATVAAGAGLVQLIGTCRIGRNTPVDGDTGPVDSWAQVASSVACRLFGARLSPEVMVGEERQSITVFRMQLPLGQDCQPADQIEKDGALFEVIDTDAGTDYAVYLTAFLTRVRSIAIAW
jgi:hypothetical protein